MIRRVQYASPMVMPVRRLKFQHTDQLFQQSIEPLYHIPTDSIYLPGTYLKFPYMVETLPIWMFFGAVGHTMGHELTHAFEGAAKKHAKNTEKEEHWYHKRYQVRLTRAWREVLNWRLVVLETLISIELRYLIGGQTGLNSETCRVIFLEKSAAKQPIMASSCHSL